MKPLSMELRKHTAPMAAFALLGGLAAVYLTGRALSPEDSASACDNPRPLELVRMTDGSIYNGFNVLNEGPCTAIYDRDSLKTVASIATHESFVVVCEDSKPNSFMVDANGTTGYVNFSNTFHFDRDGEQPLVEGC